jgi:hypothetical protein
MRRDAREFLYECGIRCAFHPFGAAANDDGRDIRG